LRSLLYHLVTDGRCTDARDAVLKAGREKEDL
jgi:hypothetical protein